MSKTIVLIILCHLMGDYVLQCDFIAQTKGKNWYHLFVHCALYCVPFLVVFGWTWLLAVIFISHLQQGSLSLELLLCWQLQEIFSSLSSNAFKNISAISFSYLPHIPLQSISAITLEKETMIRAHIRMVKMDVKNAC